MSLATPKISRINQEYFLKKIKNKRAFSRTRKYARRVAHHRHRPRPEHVIDAEGRAEWREAARWAATGRRGRGMAAWWGRTGRSGRPLARQAAGRAEVHRTMRCIAVENGVELGAAGIFVPGEAS